MMVVRWIINLWNIRKIKKHLKPLPYDVISEINKLVNEGFSQRQALAIINAIANWRAGQK